ncbi:MAG: CBS domain-containing protein [Candidatus Peregrinibacteria bacterium]
MITEFHTSHGKADHVYYLSDVLGVKVVSHGRSIGRLQDIIIVENGHAPVVTKLFVRRPFGDPTLLIPWDRVMAFGAKEIVVRLENIPSCEGIPGPTDVLLRDHILDKKVVDVEDRDVEVVYDVKMMVQGGNLLVSSVNISRYRLLRRLGLKWLAKAIYFFLRGDRDEKIPWEYVQPLPPNIGSFKGDVKLTVMKEKLAEIHPADLADILEELDNPQRVALFSELETSHASDTLEEVDPPVQRDLVASMKKERAAVLLDEMTAGQAADILSVLPLNEAREILKLLKAKDPEDTRKIEAILGHQEEQIANFTTNKLIDLPATETAAKAVEQFLKEAKDRDVVLNIYVVENDRRLVGVLNLKEILRAKPEQKLREFMVDNVVKLRPDSTLRDALTLFRRYDFRALPVVDRDDKLVGVVPYRDVMNLRHRFFD